MNPLLLVLNVKATAFLKSAFDVRSQSLLKNLSSLLVFGGVALGVFFLARGVTGYLIQQAHIGQFLYHRFLSMLLYVFFVTVNLGNMIVCYATLYRSEEVSFLMGLPISHERIFLIKFIDNFFYSSGTLTLLGLSWLLGYGSFYYMPWYFYFLTIFAVLLPFMLIAGFIAVTLLMVMIRIASKIGIRWLLALIVVVYLSAIYVYFQVSNPVQLVEQVMRHYPDVNQYFGYLDAPLVRYLPNHWVAEFLYWSVHGDYARAFFPFFMLLITLAALMVVAGFMARLYYYKSWVAAGDARAMGGQRVPLFRLRLMEFGRRTLMRTSTDVLVKRDFWVFFREPSQWLHLLLMTLLLLIFLVSLGSMTLKLSQPLLQAVSFLVVFLFNGFLIASVSLRFVFPAVSLEGPTFWAVRSSPISLKKLYWYKFGFALALILLVGEVLAITSIALLRDNPSLVFLSGVCTAFIALALTSINMGAGTVFATFREKNPMRIASSQGASLTFLMSMVYLSIVVALLILPLHTYFEDLIIRGTTPEGWMTVPVAGIGILSVFLFIVSTVLGLRSISRDY
jgi:ABC-2 type transport system permease protein